MAALQTRRKRMIMNLITYNVNRYACKVYMCTLQSCITMLSVLGPNRVRRCPFTTAGAAMAPDLPRSTHEPVLRNGHVGARCAAAAAPSHTSAICCATSHGALFVMLVSTITVSRWSG